MKRLSQLNETTWGGMVRRSSSDVKRIEDVPEPQDASHWWRYIELDKFEKYPDSEITSWKITYKIVNAIKKTMGIETPEIIDVYFKNEVWDLIIDHDTSYGNDRYVLKAHGEYSPWFVNFSELTKSEKRSIRQRIDKKNFYIYTYKNGGRIEYILRETPLYMNDKGIKLEW